MGVVRDGHSTCVASIREGRIMIRLEQQVCSYEVSPKHWMPTGNKLSHMCNFSETGYASAEIRVVVVVAAVKMVSRVSEILKKDCHDECLG
jgi:hypothetical protein